MDFYRRTLFLCFPIIVVSIALSLSTFTHNAYATSTSVGHWILDDTSTTTAADSSGNGFNGTIVNATSSASVPSEIKFTDTGSLSFNSADSSYVILPGTGLVGGGAAWSICAWFNSTSTALQDIYSEGNNSEFNSIVTIQMNATVGNVRLFLRDNSGSNNVSVSAGATVNDGNWHLVCAVKTSDTDSRLYVDNTQYSPTSSNASLGSVPTLNVDPSAQKPARQFLIISQAT